MENKVEQGGLAALARKHGNGQFCELTPEQLAELKGIILNKMKNGYLPNFVPTTEEKLVAAVRMAD